MIIAQNGIGFSLNEQSLALSFFTKGCKLNQLANEEPCFYVGTEKVFFSSASSIKHEMFETGIETGVRSTFSGFSLGDRSLNFRFSTLISLDLSDYSFKLSLVPLQELDADLELTCIEWPSPFGLQDNINKQENKTDFCPPLPASNYTVLPYLQGLFIPDDWPTPLAKLPFSGRFGTAAAYMPWFAQFRGNSAYMLIVKTPANAVYEPEHIPNQPSKVKIAFEPSLGQVAYRREIKLILMTNADYNTACAYYRNEAKKSGRYLSLASKAAQNPTINRLCGSFFVHCGIKTHIQPDSEMFDPKEPDKNERIVTFKERSEQVANFAKLGIKKLYMHLDGWAEPGYDNEHPDFYPPCEAAGGLEAMQNLINTMHKYGYLFGIHDQYRDFYFRAPSFDKEQACLEKDGTIFEHARWAGGRQSLLCADLARSYVKRNFSRVLQDGLELDAAYLDVFTCNEGDECYNKEHLMSRGDCYKYRNECFDYLTANGIVPSSEEVNDWAVRSLVFCHYAPYDFMLREPGSPKYGLPVPLFNLVYHDCLLIPWMMEKHENEDYMLYALLNGGVSYYIRDAAYPNIDGAFAEGRVSEPEQRQRCQVVANLHEQVAFMPLSEHHFLDASGTCQESIFGEQGNISVWVDFTKNAYKITKN